MRNIYLPPSLYSGQADLIGFVNSVVKMNWFSEELILKFPLVRKFSCCFVDKNQIYFEKTVYIHGGRIIFLQRKCQCFSASFLAKVTRPRYGRVVG